MPIEQVYCRYARLNPADANDPAKLPSKRHLAKSSQDIHIKLSSQFDDPYRWFGKDGHSVIGSYTATLMLWQMA